MNRTNRTGKYVDAGTNGYKRGDFPNDKTKLKYYIQKIDAISDSHGYIQAKDGSGDNYEEYASLDLGRTGYTFSEEEFINIEGFITPSPASSIKDTCYQDWWSGTWYTIGDPPHYNDTNVDAPGNGQYILYKENTSYSG